ncbi:MAG TPA: phosphoribosylformylglycinamidine synthase subunit PurS [Candidatus Aenigmarchaeota archaeon]|nr:phosphoribosylformylglycinamidine synthase subunit PurS [Candidatus Aenigmarchaeota archaeon]
MKFNVDIKIALKKGVADPEGENVKKTLNLLGLEGIEEVHTAKLYTVEIEAESREKAEAEATVICEKLLANPVINTYTIKIRS